MSAHPAHCLRPHRQAHLLNGRHILLSLPCSKLESRAAATDLSLMFPLGALDPGAPAAPTPAPRVCLGLALPPHCRCLLRPCAPPVLRHRHPAPVPPSFPVVPPRACSLLHRHKRPGIPSVRRHPRLDEPDRRRVRAGAGCFEAACIEACPATRERCEGTLRPPLAAGTAPAPLFPARRRQRSATARWPSRRTPYAATLAAAGPWAACRPPPTSCSSLGGHWG